MTFYMVSSEGGQEVGLAECESLSPGNADTGDQTGPFRLKKNHRAHLGESTVTACW